MPLRARLVTLSLSTLSGHGRGTLLALDRRGGEPHFGGPTTLGWRLPLYDEHRMTGLILGLGFGERVD